MRSGTPGHSGGGDLGKNRRPASFKGFGRSISSESACAASKVHPAGFRKSMPFEEYFSSLSFCSAVHYSKGSVTKTA